MVMPSWTKQVSSKRKLYSGAGRTGPHFWGNDMENGYCEICDYGDLKFDSEWYCEFWSCFCEEVEDCDIREIT